MADHGSDPPVGRQEMQNEKELARVDRQPLVAHGDLPRQATSPSER